MTRTRQRDRREAQALAFLKLHRGLKVSALDLGAAAVRGERWAARRTWRAQAAIGLEIAVALTRSGIVRPTRGNQFELA